MLFHLHFPGALRHAVPLLLLFASEPRLHLRQLFCLGVLRAAVEVLTKLIDTSFVGGAGPNGPPRCRVSLGQYPLGCGLRRGDLLTCDVRLSAQGCMLPHELPATLNPFLPQDLDCLVFLRSNSSDPCVHTRSLFIERASGSR